MSDQKEKNLLEVVFKEKTRKIPHDEASRAKMLEFGREYWDDPNYPGCGGYTNDGRWAQPAKLLTEFFKLKEGSRVLDLCCGKGFLLEELHKLNSDFILSGIDVSEYAVTNSVPEVKDCIQFGSGSEINFPDNHFDLVLCLNSLYIMELEECKIALREIQRVSKNAFVQVNSYRTEVEKDNLIRWDASARIVKSTKEWTQLFQEVGYEGYYYWNIFL